MAAKRRQRRDHDEDSPEMTARDFAQAKPLRKALPEVVEAMKRGRGRPRVASPKARVSLRVDSDVIAAYRATGSGWQRRIHETLARGAARLKPKRRAGSPHS